MKKVIVLFCSIIMATCFSCKKTCTCYKITVDNRTGDVISSRYEGTHEIDRNTTCKMLATDKNGNDAGLRILTWFFIFTVSGNPAQFPNTNYYYECSER